jgi:hypothetical protein
MTNERLMIYKAFRNQKIREATYCDFDREQFIKRFDELDMKAQVVILRGDLITNTKKTKYRLPRLPIQERLKRYKSRNDWFSWCTEGGV